MFSTCPPRCFKAVFAPKAAAEHQGPTWGSGGLWAGGPERRLKARWAVPGILLGSLWAASQGCRPLEEGARGVVRQNAKMHGASEVPNVLVHVSRSQGLRATSGSSPEAIRPGALRIAPGTSRGLWAARREAEEACDELGEGRHVLTQPADHKSGHLDKLS